MGDRESVRGEDASLLLVLVRWSPAKRKSLVLKMLIFFFKEYSWKDEDPTLIPKNIFELFQSCTSRQELG